MKAVVQRVLQARVDVSGELISEIGPGLLVLVGVAQGDQPGDAAALAGKISVLRVFDDGQGKMNHSVLDITGAVLAVPQFTLLGDCRRGRRPDFTQAAPPNEGSVLFDLFCREVEARNVSVKRGVFRAHMQVSLVNDGPVTLLLDSRKND